MSQKKVVVAMSGGVDSSVAAALLKNQGYEVIGLTMKLFSLPAEVCLNEELRSCCGFKAVEDAQQVCWQLGIPHFVVDLREDFEKWVIENFCQEYVQGRTPNPCIRCNEFIKFRRLWEKVKNLGADFLATGHHARIEFDEKRGRFLLKKGRDIAKDQSYFLYPLTQEQLKRTLFPVGNYTKAQIRHLASKFGLHVADRAESQEICFVLDGDYINFLKSRKPEAFRPGPIMDKTGRQLGEHQGIAHFTIGQRRGMKISWKKPLYVIGLDPERKAVIVGEEKELLRKKLIATKVNLIALDKIDLPITVKAKIRYKHEEAKAIVSPLEKDSVVVEFIEPQRAITPGQSVVFYQKQIVLGGGIIDQVLD
ncbi:MAG: tRNA 2-thiouridine(34) synthase MnmA [Candidatus Aminicenantes bacterium]|nr:tRNA 2-thiouridine(34) synthase MnmA [Candidatus Aminicenantes bacterium]